MKALQIKDIAWEEFWNKRSGYGPTRMMWFLLWADISWEDMFGKEAW